MTSSFEQPLEEIVLPDTVDWGQIGPEAGTEALQTDLSESLMNQVCHKWDTEGKFTGTIILIEEQQQRNK